MPGRTEDDSGGRQDGAVLDEEDVLAAALADVAADVEGDAFFVAVEQGFHLDELGVHVVGAGLGQGRERVRGHAPPGGDADVDAVLHGLGAEVLAPLPDQDGAVDGVGEGIDAERAVAAVDDRPDVAGLELVGPDGVDRRPG